MTAKQLNIITHEQYPYLIYEAHEAQHYIDNGGFVDTDEDTAAWLFVDYLVGLDLCTAEPQELKHYEQIHRQP